MNKYINNSDKRADTTRKEYFQYWWDNVNRYVFEEDLELFKKYFVYLYEGMTPEYANQPGTMPEDRYNHYLEVINAMIDYEDYSDDEDCLTSDPCTSLCNPRASNYIVQVLHILSALPIHNNINLARMHIIHVKMFLLQIMILACLVIWDQMHIIH